MRTKRWHILWLTFYVRMLAKTINKYIARNIIIIIVVIIMGIEKL